MNKVKQWFGLNKLSLNLSKTKVMRFGEGKEINQISIVNNQCIERVSEYDFLGVMLDQKNLIYTSQYMCVCSMEASSMFFFCLLCYVFMLENTSN